MGIQVQPCCCPDPHHFFLASPLRCYNDLEEDPDHPGYWAVDWVLGTPAQVAGYSGRVATNPDSFSATNFDVVGVGAFERLLVMSGFIVSGHHLGTIKPDGTNLSTGPVQGVSGQAIGPTQVDYARRRTYFVQMQPPSGTHLFPAWQAPHSLKVAANLTDAAATLYTWSASELPSFYGMVYVPEQDAVYVGVTLCTSSALNVATNAQVHKITAAGVQSVIADLTIPAFPVHSGGEYIGSLGHDPITGKIYFSYLGDLSNNPRIYQCNYDGSGLATFAGPFNPSTVVLAQHGPIQVDVSGRRVLYARRPNPGSLQIFYREIGGATSILLYDQPPMLMGDSPIPRFVFGRGFVEIDGNWGG